MQTLVLPDWTNHPQGDLQTLGYLPTRHKPSPMGLQGQARSFQSTMVPPRRFEMGDQLSSGLKFVCREASQCGVSSASGMHPMQGLYRGYPPHPFLLMWLWVKNAYRKNKPAVPWWLNVDPHSCAFSWIRMLLCTLAGSRAVCISFGRST